MVDGLYFPGYSIADAAPDLGDSAITETAGLGGFAMAAAPAIVNFVGGTPDDAIANTVAMGHITLGQNSAFTLPATNFSGTPAGIDARKVVDTGHPADHQHRDRSSRGGDRADRGRHHACAARLFHAGDRRAGRHFAGDVATRTIREERMASDKKLAVVAIGGNSLISDKDHLTIPISTKPWRSPCITSPT